MPLDREQARAVLLDALPADPKWGVWVDGILDRLEPCVTPRLAEIDVRLVGEAEAKLARIRAVCDRYAQQDDPGRPYLLPEDGTRFLVALLAILDGPTA